MDVQEQGRADGVVAPAGLTQREADALRRRGEGNTAVRRSSRSYGRILRTDVFSFFTTTLFVIGAALRALGREVVREEVVRGDVLHLRPGDQVVVDGPVLDGGLVEVDESLLTGESEALLRRPGDDLLSGSSCVGGAGHQLALPRAAAPVLRLVDAAGRRPAPGRARRRAGRGVLRGPVRPAFTGYLGLTDAADPVFRTVLPALVVWFVVLSAAYRGRLLERTLGLAPPARDGVPAH